MNAARNCFMSSLCVLSLLPLSIFTFLDRIMKKTWWMGTPVCYSYEEDMVDGYPCILFL